jgi:hypothetical protein
MSIETAPQEVYTIPESQLISDMGGCEVEEWVGGRGRGRGGEGEGGVGREGVGACRVSSSRNATQASQ